MRNIFFLGLLLFLSESVTAQKVEYRQDSLYIQGVYVDAYTPKESIDKLLQEAGTIKEQRSLVLKNGTRGKRVKEKTAYYPDHGVYIRWYDDDSAKFSIGIKLYTYTSARDEKVFGIPGKPFTGELFIGGNYMNDKRSVTALSKLNGCIADLTEVSVGLQKAISGADLVCKENLIKLAFDSRNDEMTQLVIYHNFNNE